MSNTQEFGRTVDDARRLALKARLVYVFFRAGPRDGESGVIPLDRDGFLRAVHFSDGARAMPCELHGDVAAGPQLWIGGSEAVARLAEPRAPRRPENVAPEILAPEISQP